MADVNQTYPAPVHPTPPPVVHVSGTYREMGRQIGEAQRAAVQNSIQNAHVVLKETRSELKMDWESAILHSQKYLPFALKRYPKYVDEIRGIAEGADVDFEDLMVVTVLEALTSDALHLMRCTCMAVSQERSANRHVLAAHNEDWVSEDENDVYVIHAEPKDAPPYLAMTYGGLLPNVGFNAYGIAQLINSVYPKDSRVGVPRLVLTRAVLEAKTPGQAIDAAIIPRRAAGYNHMIVHESGEMYNVEVSARRFSILYSDNNSIVHTNHYLSRNLQKIEDSPEDLTSSRVRYFRARRLLSQTDLHTIESLQAIQRDHINYPSSICNHDLGEKKLSSNEKTIAALVIDLTARQMHIAWGNPCQNAYHTYSLNA